MVLDAGPNASSNASTSPLMLHLKSYTYQAVVPDPSQPLIPHLLSEPGPMVPQPHQPQSDPPGRAGDHANGGHVICGDQDSVSAASAAAAAIKTDCDMDLGGGISELGAFRVADCRVNGGPQAGNSTDVHLEVTDKPHHSGSPAGPKTDGLPRTANGPPPEGLDHAGPSAADPMEHSHEEEEEGAPLKESKGSASDEEKEADGVGMLMGIPELCENGRPVPSYQRLKGGDGTGNPSTSSVNDFDKCPQVSAMLKKLSTKHSVHIQIGLTPLSLLNTFIGSSPQYKLEVSEESKDAQGPFKVVTTLLGPSDEEGGLLEPVAKGTGLASAVKTARQFSAASALEVLLSAGFLQEEALIPTSFKKRPMAEMEEHTAIDAGPLPPAKKEVNVGRPFLLTEYPRCDDLLTRIQTEVGCTLKTPIMVVQEYAQSCGRKPVYLESQALSGEGVLFSCSVSLPSINDTGPPPLGPVIGTGRGKQDARQSAAAVMLEWLLSEAGGALTFYDFRRIYFKRPKLR
eukprot:gene28251-31356_t